MREKKYRPPGKKALLSHSIIAGFFSGAAEGFSTAPFNALKVQKQYVGKYTFDPAVLYRGSLITSFTMAVCISLRITVNDILLYRLPPEGSSFQNNTLYKGACAFLGGMSSSIFLGPVELGTTLQQKAPANMRSTFLKTIKDLSLKKGYLILSTGVLGVGMRDGFVNAGFLYFASAYRDLYAGLGYSDALGHLFAGISGGLTAQILSQPFDTVKTIRQGNADVENQGANRYSQIIKGIYSRKGLVGFYAGSIWRGARIVSGVTLLSIVTPRIRESLEVNPPNFQRFFTHEPPSLDEGSFDEGVEQKPEEASKKYA